MAYTKHNWQDEIVQYPSRYKLKNTGTGIVEATYDLERETGTVTAQDPIVAMKLNNIENGVFNNDVNIDISRIAKLSTGSANAYVVDTEGTFDLTLDGNILTFIPHATNTGASTIALDSQSTVSIEKIDDSGSAVALEAGDLLANRPVQIVRRVGTNVFILRPSGGDISNFFKKTPLSKQTPVADSVGMALRTTVTGKGWVVFVNSRSSGNLQYKIEIDGAFVVGGASNSIRLSGYDTHFFLMRFESEFKYYSDSGTQTVYYMIGDKFGEGFNKFGSTPSNAYLAYSITGKGLLQSMSQNIHTTTPSGSFNLVVDGVNFGLLIGGNTFPLFIKFNSTVELYTANDVTAQYWVMNYTLD